jgi:hypothetical protein
MYVPCAIVAMMLCHSLHSFASYTSMAH